MASLGRATAPTSSAESAKWRAMSCRSGGMALRRRRLSRSAAAPAAAEQAAPITSVPVRPSSSIRSTPAASVPDDGADCVRRIEAPKCTGEVRAGGEMACERWKRCSHQDGRGRQGEHRQAEAQQGDELRRALKRWIRSAVYLVEQMESERRSQHDHHQHQFDGAV